MFAAEVLHRYAPWEFMERPKLGFGVPIYCWLRGTFRYCLEDLLDEKRLRNEEGLLVQGRFERFVWKMSSPSGPDINICGTC